MITLRADNRQLTQNSPYSYLNTNYSSGVSSMVLISWIDFQVDDYLLIGEWGSESSEIVQIESIAGSTNTLTFKNATKFSHAESTKITIIRYNLVMYYWTSTTTASTSTHVSSDVQLGDDTTQFDITNPAGDTYTYTWDGTGTNPLIADFVQTGHSIVINAEDFSAGNNDTFTITGVGTNSFSVTNASGVAEDNKTIGTGSIKVSSYRVAISADSYFTDIGDEINTDGYGWFMFYNTTTDTYTALSQYIPYGGFEEDSAKSMLDAFYDLLSNKEQKLITDTQAYRWLNEGYSKIFNALGLINKEYNSPTVATVPTVSGTAEYLISDYMTNFADIISVFNGTDDAELDNCPLGMIDSWGSESGNAIKYYLRGDYIGFTPTPTEAVSYSVRYSPKSSTIDSYIDELNLPDNSFYCVVDWMLYRASQKISRLDGKSNKEAFDESVKNMQLTSHKRDNHLDSWGIANNANV